MAELIIRLIIAIILILISISLLVIGLRTVIKYPAPFSLDVSVQAKFYTGLIGTLLGLIIFVLNITRNILVILNIYVNLKG